MAAPDLTGTPLGFTPATFWIPGDYDPRQLIIALKAQEGLGNFTDDAGNSQSAVRLDTDTEGASGFWASVPEGTAQETIDAGVAAYEAPPEPEAPSPSALVQLATIVVGALDSVPDGSTTDVMRDAVKGAIAEAAGL